MALLIIMDKEYKEMLRNQSYGFAGETTAVKICSWTKKALTDEGVCYKEKFYGIRCHRCCQMSPACNTCSLNCIFCWRERYESQFDKIDDPEQIIDNCIAQQKLLLTGYGGNDKADKDKLHEAFEPKHFAISLTGEPTCYPKISEFIQNLHDRGNTTFLVTNGMFPEVLKSMTLPTQLYVSLDAPDEELFQKVDRPDSKLDQPWNRLMQTLDLLKSFKDKTRTTIRITLVKDYNMVHPEKWSALIEKADPTYVEVKGYVWVGSSRQRLELSNSPPHEEVKAFAEEICKHCNYRFIDEQKASRVVLIMKEDRDDRIMQF